MTLEIFPSSPLLFAASKVRKALIHKDSQAFSLCFFNMLHRYLIYQFQWGGVTLSGLQHAFGAKAGVKKTTVSKYHVGHPPHIGGIAYSDKYASSPSGSAKEAKPQTVAKEANMIKVAKKHGKEKRGQVNFNGKACWVGVDVHKVSYAVAILDEDGQQHVFSTSAEPKKLS